jgi:hypothetical protein
VLSSASTNAIDCDVYILSDLALRTLKYKPHDLPQKTYFLVKHKLEQILLYCLDKGSDKWLRELELDDAFVSKLTNIDQGLLTKIESVSNPVFVNNEAARVSKQISSFAFQKLIGLLTSYEKINFKIWRGHSAHQKKLAKIIDDTYLLTYDAQGRYELKYYLADKKIKIPLLTYQHQTKSYKILCEKTTFSVYDPILDEVCISWEGLTHFANLLKQSQRKIRLLKLLKLYHIPKPELDLYQQAKLVVANVKILLDDTFKKVLDQKYYQKFMVEAHKDKLGRYIFEETNRDEVIVKYQRYINLMINLQDMLEKTSVAHNLVLKADSNFKVVKLSPWIWSAYSEWVNSYSEIYPELIALDIISILQNLASVEGLQNVLLTLLPINQEALTLQFQNNPFYASYTKDVGNWQNIFQGTDQKLIALQKILNQLAGKLPQGGLASKTIQKTIADINVVLTAISYFSNSPRQLIDVIKLVYKVYPKFSSLLKDLPTSLVSLNSVFKDHFLMTAQQINLIFRDIAVNLDVLEIQYRLREQYLLKLDVADLIAQVNRISPAIASLFSDMPTTIVALGGVLKDNFFKIMQQVWVMLEGVLKHNNLDAMAAKCGYSLYSMMEIFNAAIEEMGYEFLEEERFPYVAAIIANRKKMAAVSTDAFLLERIQDLQLRLNQQDGKLASQRIFQQLEQYRVDNCLTAITTLINKLECAPVTWSTLAKPLVKIALLQKLSQKIPTTSSIHAAINALGLENKANLENLDLLWDSETGVVLRKLLHENQLSNSQMLDAIDVEIDKHEAVCAAPIRMFYISINTPSENIVALHKFKKLLIKPGFLLSNALDELNATYPKDYQVLLTCQKKLLDELKYLESHIIKSITNRIPIDLVNAKHKILASDNEFEYVRVQILRLQHLRCKEYSYFERREPRLEQQIYTLLQLQVLMRVHPDLSIPQIIARLAQENQDLLNDLENTVLDNLTRRNQARLTLAVNLSIDPVVTPAQDLIVPRVALVNTSAPGAVSEHDIYKHFIQNLITWKNQLDALFDAALDPRIYEQFFKHVVTDQLGRFDLNSTMDEPYWINQYKRLHNLFINFRVCIQQLERLHIPAMKHYEKNNLIALVQTVPPRLSDLKEAYEIFYMDLDQLEIFPFLQKITNKKSFQKAFLGLMPSAAFNTAIANTSVMSGIGQQDLNWIYESQLQHKLDSLQNAFLHLDESLPADLVVTDATKKSIKDFSRVIKETRKFGASSGGWVNLIRFVYAVYPFAYELSQNYSQAYAASDVLFKKQFLSAMLQLNVVCREIILGLDKLKINAFLTDNGAYELSAYPLVAGMSVNTLLNAFNTFINNLGYEFKTDERYPYRLTLIQQRQDWALSGALPADLCLPRVNAMQNLFKIKSAVQSVKDLIVRDNISNQKFGAVAQLIDQRIFDLTQERSKWYVFTSTKTIKINLLNQLKLFLKDNSFQEAMALMEPQLDAKTRPYLYYLFEGRTGNVINEVQKIKSTPQDLVQMCNQEIIRLTRQSSSMLFFGSMCEVEKSISSLKQLKAILAKPGYRINAALTELNGTRPELYQHLLSRQAKLLDAIHELDPLIPDFQIGKTPIELLEVPSNVVGLNQVDMLERLDAEIIYWRKQRCQTPGWLWSNTRLADRCGRLLTELKAALTADPGSIEHFLNGLPLADKNFFKNQNATLLQEIRIWQGAPLERADFFPAQRVI